MYTGCHAPTQMHIDAAVDDPDATPHVRVHPRPLEMLTPFLGAWADVHLQR